MRDHLLRGQTRIDQHAALHWTWMTLQSNTKKKSIENIRNMLRVLAKGTDVDFEGIIKQLMEDG